MLGPLDRFRRFGVPVIPDRESGRGPLMALCTGLENSKYDWNIFLACDLPFVDRRFLEFLARKALLSQAEAVVPRTPDGWQPLCAAYSRKGLQTIRHALQNGYGRLTKVFESLRVDEIPMRELIAAGIAERTFRNLNTMKDWEAVKHEAGI
ncbi:MAG: molybdenum cofactor guanylyltransferase [Acidobacteria bacterium]|nr:molybdenum cofactor guanylyltransferase [Acidobacteriota bacterium]